MSLEWIDIYVDGLVEHCYSNDIYEIYNMLDIHILKVNANSFMLQGKDSVYIKNYFGSEVVFIRDDLPYQFEKFVLSHELGHAILHVELSSTAFNYNLTNKGKLEKQADYFAIRLLEIKLDSYYYEGLTKTQIALDLCVREDSLDYIIKEDIRCLVM